jgi:hypothetical protein
MRRLGVSALLFVLAAFPAVATISPSTGGSPSPTLLFIDGPLAGYQPSQVIALVGFVGIAAYIARKRRPLI